MKIWINYVLKSYLLVINKTSKIKFIKKYHSYGSDHWK
jgi:hypothetical protein